MLSEFELIAKYFTRPVHNVGLGVGDDCALLAAPTGLQLAVTTDMLVEGTHFLPGADPERLGHKTLAVNLSDLAAMGADPRWFLLAVSLPRVDEPWLEAFTRGLFALADAHRIELAGGDTTRGPLTLTVTAIGTVPPGYALRRDGARPGDDIWLSGATGDAALALAHLRGRLTLDGAAREHCVQRLERPEPRVGLGRRLRGVASSAIDVSDGLLADLGHILERSGVGAEIAFDDLPRSDAVASAPDPELARACLLGGGDDYELLFTAAVGDRNRVEAAGVAAGVPLARIGTVIDGAALRLVDGRGRPIEGDRAGFDHFGSD